MSPLLAQLSTQVNRAASQGGKGGGTNEALQSIIQSLSFLKNLMLSILILVIFYFLGRLIASRIVRKLQEAKGDSLYPDVEALVYRFSVFGSLFVGFSVVLQFIFGVDFLQIVGFFGLGIGFAFKDLLQNLIAGAMIIIQNRFRVGDMIRIGGPKGIYGKIMEIQTRITILKAIDGTEIIVPNAKIMNSMIICTTSHPRRRIDFTINIDLDADVNKAKKLAVEVCLKHPQVLKKPIPHVIVKDIGGSGTSMLDGSGFRLNVRFWIDPQNRKKSWVITRSELISKLKAAFDRHGILVTYPLFSYLEKKRKIVLKKKAEISGKPAETEIAGATEDRTLEHPVESASAAPSEALKPESSPETTPPLTGPESPPSSPAV